MREFNIGGPCKADIDYMLPPEQRLSGVREVIDAQRYFVLHAPRQTGKTTGLVALAKSLTAEGRYVSALLSVQVGASAPDDPDVAEPAILEAWRGAARWQLPAELQPPPWPDASPRSRIGAALAAWAEAAPRPLVVFLDEIDSLEGATLVSVLHQLRDRHPGRPEHFPASLALVGMRDVRDYKLASGGADRTHSASPFNILVRSFTLRDFTAGEVGELYAQHTSDTGQRFDDDAVSEAFRLTAGQPWLVNALARCCVSELVRDRGVTVTAGHVSEAKEVLIRRQDTHLDSLGERLREPRVRAVIEPMLAGTALRDVPNDDLRYVIDLGLARTDNGSTLRIANPIYREVIPRVLASNPAASLPEARPEWLDAEGRLDPPRLLDAFLRFWRQHGEPLMRAAPYHEVAPHLVMMAWLHRVANRGGTLDREYAIGSGRMDLCLRLHGVSVAIEIKVWRPGEPDPLAEGLEQLDGYLAGLGLPTGWLQIFDRRPDQPRLAERTTVDRAVTPSGRKVVVVRG